jgi:hypothetical protein
LPNNDVKHRLTQFSATVVAEVFMLSAIVKNLNREQWISEAAYYKALAKNFQANQDIDNWLEAEQEYLTMLINLQINVLEEDGTISVMGLRQIAESLGIQNLQQMRLEFELIRAIQEASHHRGCFQSNDSKTCDETNCHWKSKCKRLVAVWHR